MTGPRYQWSLSAMLGPSALDEEEIDTLRRRAWHEQDLFIVPPLDRRLTTEESVALIVIAERLYGKQSKP